jgi:hypothetical protein
MPNDSTLDGNLWKSTWSHLEQERLFAVVMQMNKLSLELDNFLTG